MKARYDKGTRVGTWKFYDESGKMVKEIDYDKEKAIEALITMLFF